MRTNCRPVVQRTFEGAATIALSPLQQLRRSVLSCLLWEDQFYEDGEAIADRIKALVRKCKPEDVSALAIESRQQYYIRHASLLVARELARHPKIFGRLIGDTISGVVQRADELAEFLSLYWSEGKTPISKQVKEGLKTAFRRFDAYQLAKYNRDSAIKLRDVLFLIHAKPKDEAQAALWKQLAEDSLPIPLTWETELSAGKDKRETFTRLLTERKIGYLALLRNLRNMVDAGVDRGLIKDAVLAGAGNSKTLPFRFLAAARHAPSLEPELDQAMQKAMLRMPRLEGRTFVLVDVSGSMVGTKISQKSELDRLDAAAALAVLVRGVSEEARVFVFSDYIAEVPPRTGMALVDAIKNARHGGTKLGQAITHLNQIGYDRLVVITDEQSADSVPPPQGKGYMINVGSYNKAVGYGDWVRLTGFSEAVVQWIQALESEF